MELIINLLLSANRLATESGSLSDFLVVLMEHQKAIEKREGGDSGIFFALVPKVFLFVSLTTLETFIEF